MNYRRRFMGKFLLGVISLIFIATGQAFAAKATAVIQSTDGNSPLVGSAHFEDTSDGLRVEVSIFGAPPGPHGFHIHENGSCEDKGGAAGGHFNPTKTKHGFLPKDGLQAAHGGDMGNMDVMESGEGTLLLVLPDVTIEGGKYNVAGRAVILHEKKDDFGQPTGNAGRRIGCGIIQVDRDQ